MRQPEAAQAEAESAVPAAYADPVTTPLTVTVGAGETVADFALSSAPAAGGSP